MVHEPGPGHHGDVEQPDSVTMPYLSNERCVLASLPPSLSLSRRRLCCCRRASSIASLLLQLHVSRLSITPRSAPKLRLKEWNASFLPTSTTVGHDRRSDVRTQVRVDANGEEWHLHARTIGEQHPSRRRHYPTQTLPIPTRLPAPSMPHPFPSWPPTGEHSRYLAHAREITNARTRGRSWRGPAAATQLVSVLTKTPASRGMEHADSRLASFLPLQNCKRLMDGLGQTDESNGLLRRPTDRRQSNHESEVLASSSLLF